MNKFIKVFLLFITSITLSSCTEYLEEIPQNMVDAPERWIDAPIYDENNKLLPKVEGLKKAKAEYEALLYEAENEPMEWKEDGMLGEWDIIVEEVPDSQKLYIKDRIYELDVQIYEMENKKITEAKEDDYLDEANKELELFDFGDNNNKNKFDDVENINENIFQSPQTPSTPDTPSMPETFSYPDTYDYGSEG